MSPTESGCQAAFAFKTEIDTELRKLVAGLSPDLAEHLREAMAQIVAAHPQGCPRGRC